MWHDYVSIASYVAQRAIGAGVEGQAWNSSKPRCHASKLALQYKSTVFYNVAAMLPTLLVYIADYYSAIRSNKAHNYPTTSDGEVSSGGIHYLISTR